MVAVPAPIPVTLPLASTVAIAVLLEVQATPWLVAFTGAIVASRVTLEPSKIVSVSLSKVTPVTGTTGASTAISKARIGLGSVAGELL